MKKAIHVKEYTRVRHGRAKKGGKVVSHNKTCPGGKIKSKGKGLGSKGKPIGMTAYCVKCRTLREIVKPKLIVNGNRRRLSATCQVCGTGMSRIVGKDYKETSSGRATRGLTPNQKHLIKNWVRTWLSDPWRRSAREMHINLPDIDPPDLMQQLEKMNDYVGMWADANRYANDVRVDLLYGKKSSGRITPFRRREARANIMKGEGTYHKMKEDEALSKLDNKVRVVYKQTSDKKKWQDNDMWFPNYEAALTWVARAEKSSYFKDIYIDKE